MSVKARMPRALLLTSEVMDSGKSGYPESRASRSQIASGVSGSKWVSMNELAFRVPTISWESPWSGGTLSGSQTATSLISNYSGLQISDLKREGKT